MADETPELPSIKYTDSSGEVREVRDQLKESMAAAIRKRAKPEPTKPAKTKYEPFRW